MDENESYLNFFNGFSKINLNSEVRTIPTDDLSSVINSTENIISDAKCDHDEVIIILPPLNPLITIGIYIAACLKQIRVIAHASDLKSTPEHFTIPSFPFIKPTKKEQIILTQIIKHERINSKGLLKIIKNDGHYDKFSGNSTDADLTSKEETALRQIRRILVNLERLGSVNKEKNGKYLTWASTAFGKLISK